MKKLQRIHKEWFARDAVTLAQELLGKVIIYKGVGGMIVETEAYAKDPASHAFRRTPRSEIMYSTHGVFYIYFTYGMHHCLNITTDKDDVGAVLIRALEPLEGVENMARRRGIKLPRQSVYPERSRRASGQRQSAMQSISSGPGKLCSALGITRKLNGTLVNEKIEVREYKKIAKKDIVATTRIGISQAKDLPWRFYIKGNPWVSRL